MFAANMLVARAVEGHAPPVDLAFWRWASVFVLLAPVTDRPLWQVRVAALREWRDLLVLGALVMGVCGAFVYIGASTTTANNIGLIYAASPALIVLLAARPGGERLARRQLVGVALSLAGVLVLIMRSDPDVLLRIAFVPGYLWIAAAATYWAIYVVLLHYRPTALKHNLRLAAIALAGLVVLAPFHLVEALAGDVPKLDLVTIGAVVIVAVVPGWGAYTGYARLQRTLGPGVASLVMYLSPLWTAALAWVLLGEQLAAYHVVGAALVLAGVFLATREAGGRSNGMTSTLNR
ncbi:MAG: DMT family transporter [Alphaproteobacteria bacterium]|nr:DMT family transporter [Alphaproteobacteria bacterium]